MASEHPSPAAFQFTDAVGEAEMTWYTEPPSYPPCIYFLWSGSEIVYVGQTIDILSRMQSHRADQLRPLWNSEKIDGTVRKVFDRISYIPCERENLDECEYRWIKRLRPRFNRQVWPIGPTSEVCDARIESIPVRPELHEKMAANGLSTIRDLVSAEGHSPRRWMTAAERNELRYALLALRNADPEHI